ncbi:MAG: hypothetical protein U9Q81_01335 [Pseudomonadota bacterium]|nr:hypothetical protein [Pseudomonadota bacterium]
MSIKTLETVREDSKILESERTRKTRGILSQRLLSDQNLAYAGTGGISRNNRNRGFAPGYLNVRSGVAVVSCFADGRPAPLHLLDGLPEDWVLERDICGRVIKARPGVIAGFIRGSRFYTREQAARAVKH